MKIAQALTVPLGLFVTLTRKVNVFFFFALFAMSGRK